MTRTQWAGAVAMVVLMATAWVGLAQRAETGAGEPAPAAAGKAAVAPAATAGGAATAPLKEETKVTLWYLIKSGGWAMWPLGACSVALVTLVVLNFQRVSLRKMLPPATVTQITVAAQSGDVQQLWNLTTAADSFFTKALAAGLKQIQPGDPQGSRPKMEAAIAETASREESKYAFFVNFLALLTSMSPMWGLLGTVSGMIGAFSKIGGGGMGKPEILAKNISEALVCTATGLLIAIFAMGFYFYFRNILNTVMKEAEGHYSVVLDTLMGTGNTFSPVPEAEGKAGQPAQG